MNRLRSLQLVKNADILEKDTVVAPDDRQEQFVLQHPLFESQIDGVQETSEVSLLIVINF